MPELRVRRDDLASCELAEVEPHELADGEAELLVERFALTANNITYGVFGDQLGYWRLFPAPGDWGRIPAWGYSRVAASRAPELDEGRRVFGLVPMGTSFTVRPSTHRTGFADIAPHRADLSPVYNQYSSVEGDGDDAQLVMRPLFGTSVLLDLVLTEAGFNGARTVILTSASSKTAYGLAHLLRERPVETVGLTSAARRDWVEGLGLYDSVLTYEDIGKLQAPGGAVLVDFAGDQDVIRGVHEQLGDDLVRSVLVGFTHRKARSDDAPLPGPDPVFFFAPHEMARRGRELAEQYAQAWQGFAPVAAQAMRIERVTDGEGLLRVYRDLLEGRADPAAGYVVSLR